VTALRGRDYRNLWIATLISETGDWLLLIALPILVYQLTGSTLGTALAFLVELVPPVALGTVAGRLADRWNRRRALVWIAVAQAVTLLPLLVTGHLWIVYAVIATQAALSTFAEPSRNALVPALAPAGQLVGANSLLALTSNVGRLVGGPLGGALLALGNLPVIVIVDATTFVAAALLIARIAQIRPGTPSTAENVTAGEKHETANSLRRRIGAGLVVTGLTGTAQGLFVVLFVPFVARVLHGGAAETGLLRGVQAIGAILAGLALGLLATRGRVRTSAYLLAAGGAAAFATISALIWNGPRITEAEPVYAIAFAVVGAPGIVLMTGLVSALQQAAPPERIGRVFGVFTTTFAAGQALGMLAAGLLGDPLGVVVLLNVQAGLYALAGVAALAMRPPKRRQPPSGEPTTAQFTVANAS